MHLTFLSLCIMTFQEKHNFPAKPVEQVEDCDT